MPSGREGLGTIWAAEWLSKNKTDGTNQHLIYENCLPKLFKTRNACRAWIYDKYGYIAKRKDLRSEPHGWRVPRAVKVIVEAYDEG